MHEKGLESTLFCVCQASLSSLPQQPCLFTSSECLEVDSLANLTYVGGSRDVHRCSRLVINDNLLLRMIFSMGQRWQPDRERDERISKQVMDPG